MISTGGLKTCTMFSNKIVTWLMYNYRLSTILHVISMCAFHGTCNDQAGRQRLNNVVSTLSASYPGRCSVIQLMRSFNVVCRLANAEQDEF